MINKVNVLVFGDSITYGMGDIEYGSWVNRLKLALEDRKDYYYDVYNLGIPDDTSTDILKRFKQEIKSRYYQGKLIVIFAIGGNDSSQTNISIKKFKKNIKKLIYYTKKKTNKIVFLGLGQAIDSDIEGRLYKTARIRNDDIERFDNAIWEVCREKNIEFIPIKNKVKIEMLYDEVHPNQNGHEEISMMVYNYIVRKGIK